MAKSIEAQLHEALERNKQLESDIIETRRATAKVLRESMLERSRLSHTAKDRLRKAFAKSLDMAGFKQAMNVEQRGAR